MLRACGVARFTWNWALATWNEQYKSGGKPSASELRLLWNDIKKEQFPWVYESPKGANQRPFTNLHAAFRGFFKNKSKRPRFKKRGTRDSFYIENDRIAIEDLNVKGMVKNRKLARSISDAGWGEFRRQLEYKSLRYGTRIVRAGILYPSTKMCSGCGARQPMPLEQRTYFCATCGLCCDRDVNAAKNLENLLAPGFGADARGLEGSGLVVSYQTKPCQDEARTTPVGTHPGTQSREHELFNGNGAA